MKRSVGITISAVIVFAGSLLCAAMGALEIVLIFLPLPTTTTPSPRLMFAVGAVIFLLLATWGISTGVGLLRLRNWARISQVVFSAMLTLTSLVTIPVFLVMPSPPGTPDNVMRAVKLGFVCFYIALGALGAGWLYVFNKRTVRDQFAQASPASPSLRPVSITLIGWWLLSLGPFLVPIAFFRLPAFFLGRLLTGWPAALFYVAFGGAYLGIGIGLLKLQEWSRKAAIAILVFAMLNGALVMLLPASSMAAINAAMPNFMPANAPALDPDLMREILMGSMAVSTVVILVPIWFLMKRRHAFEPPSGGATPPAVSS